MEQHRRPHPAIDLERDAVDRYRDHAAVLADPPVALDADRLAPEGGVRDRAVLQRIRRPVGVLVVDGVVTGAAEHLLVAVISEELDSRIVDERDPVIPVHQPQRNLAADDKRLLNF